MRSQNNERRDGRVSELARPQLSSVSEPRGRLTPDARQVLAGNARGDARLGCRQRILRCLFNRHGLPPGDQRIEGGIAKLGTHGRE